MEEYITEIKEISSKKVLVFINDAPSFVLYKNEPEKLGIRTGEVIDSEKIEFIYDDVLYKRALNRSLGLIRAKDHSTFEIKQKLCREYYPEEVVLNVINELTDQGFLNDRRFAGTYISFYSSGKAPALMKMDLLKKGIDKDIIEDVLRSFEDEYPESEDELIRKLLSHKYGNVTGFANDDEKYKFKSKVMAFLMRKGISYEKAAEGIKNHFDI